MEMLCAETLEAPADVVGLVADNEEVPEFLAVHEAARAAADSDSNFSGIFAGDNSQR